LEHYASVPSQLQTYASPSAGVPLTAESELKGKRIGISRFGSSTDTAVRLFLAKFSLSADKDVVLVQAGEQSNRFAALVARTLDATIVGVPLDITAQKQGYPVLADLAQLRIPYPQAVVETTDRIVRDEPQLVKSYLKGLIAGIHCSRLISHAL